MIRIIDTIISSIQVSACTHRYHPNSARYDGDEDGWIWEFFSVSCICIKCGKEKEIDIRAPLLGGRNEGFFCRKQARVDMERKP